jgi:hypothetical protein
VLTSNISFEWTTYNELWDEWSSVPTIAEHAENLKARYTVRL